MTLPRLQHHHAGPALRLAGGGCLALAIALGAVPASAQQPGSGARTPTVGQADRSMRVAPRPSRTVVPAASETRFVPDEILFELAPNVLAETVLRRYGATLIASRRIELAGTTIIRARLEAGRDLRAVLAQMADDSAIAGAQPNFTYELQQELAQTVSTASGGQRSADMPTLRLSDPTAVRAAPAPSRDLPMQYVVDKLRLLDVHKLSRGATVRVAVIDSGVDIGHPELRGAVAGHFDALSEEFVPHAHGTAMAAAMVAQGQLQGVAPASRLLVARAFSGRASSASASGTSLHILAAIEWAVGQGARVINLSFAGPEDRLLSRGLAAVAARGVIAVAAAGNGGPTAAPLFPGADPSVIAVTATDADDRIFPRANRGSYIALAAPGVDVLAAEPQGRYAFSSGTSIAAAHVSGLVALVLEKRPDLDPAGVRRLLMDSAVDLGAKGRDQVYGAGRIDAAAALARAVPLTASRP
ncbi:S8 family serine peptidase [Bosea sp. (in: a-proteobacteria)]|uniref:S8 family serine peptidase n=1 Tax=Bosea sp. (in: a-proteobacteria) TaxID=1871050 RepID=UPI00356ABB76